MTLGTILAIILSAYAIGSFPTAYLVGKLVKGIDIFEHGSGNMGTTNALRTLGTFWGILVMVVDIGKGIVGVSVGRLIAPDSAEAVASLIAAIAVVAGHNWSFVTSIIKGSIKGGKGVATAGGTWMVMMPAIVIAVPLIIVAVIVLTTRYMSLGVLVAVLASILVSAFFVANGTLDPLYLLYTFSMAALIVFRLRENIKRLWQGNERRVGERVQVN